MKKNNSVCTVLVTYNRKDLLIECLDGLLKQTRPVDAIYIIDNACTDGTEELLKENGYINDIPPSNLQKPFESSITLKGKISTENSSTMVNSENDIVIHYVKMHENTGGAGGFNEGIQRAFSMGYDWFWIMDDDAEPKDDGLEKMAKYFNYENVAALSSSVLLPNHKLLLSTRGTFDFDNVFPVTQHYIKEDFYSKEYLEIDMASFVGVLVNRKAVEKIGFPKKEFFIHYDDTEYSIRLKEYGKILLIPESIIYHKEASKKYDIKSFFGRQSPRVPFKQFWLSYYGKRNLVWIGKKYSNKLTKFYIRMLSMYIRQIFAIILYDDNKLKRMSMVSSAFYDGLTGRFDNKKSKKILY